MRFHLLSRDAFTDVTQETTKRGTRAKVVWFFSDFETSDWNQEVLCQTTSEEISQTVSEIDKCV